MTDQPLVTHVYTADPSAHVFNGKLYVYPSHDIATDIQDNDNGIPLLPSFQFQTPLIPVDISKILTNKPPGDQYAMEDYHVFSMEKIGGPVTDHGVALSSSNVPWVSKQMWAPDAATKNGKYYLYFPARNKSNVFQIGVAVSDKPEGPFTPQPEP